MFNYIYIFYPLVKEKLSDSYYYFFVVYATLSKPPPGFKKNCVESKRLFHTNSSQIYYLNK